MIKAARQVVRDSRRGQQLIQAAYGQRYRFLVLADPSNGAALELETHYR
jgi:regulator of extracellular matrix RemA (YlzA/DUF370 family)